MHGTMTNADELEMNSQLTQELVEQGENRRSRQTEAHQKPDEVRSTYGATEEMVIP